MKRFKIVAFFQEKKFQFLSKIQVDQWSGEPDQWCAEHGCTEEGFHTHPIFLGPNNVVSVEVSRISPEFLQIRVWYYAEDDSQMLYLLDKEGGVLTSIEQSTNYSEEYQEMETIGEALLRLENPDDVHYALRVDKVGECDYSITLYKSPRGFTLKAWVEEQLHRAAVQIEASIAAIDAEAQRSLF